MIKVLSEYKVIESKRGQYFSLLPKIKTSLLELGAETIHIYEGTQQPGLFVEEFLVRDAESYQYMKNLRLQERDVVWIQFFSCIDGGKNKFNQWAFTKIL